MLARYVRSVPVRGHGRGRERPRVRDNLRGSPSRRAARDQSVPLAPISEAVVQALVFRKPGAARRRGAYRALLDRVRNAPRHGGRARSDHEPRTDRRSPGRAGRLRILPPARRPQDRHRCEHLRGLVRDVRRPHEPFSARFRVRLHHPLGAGRHGAPCAGSHPGSWRATKRTGPPGQCSDRPGCTGRSGLDRDRIRTHAPPELLRRPLGQPRSKPGQAGRDRSGRRSDLPCALRASGAVGQCIQDRGTRTRLADRLLSRRHARLPGPRSSARFGPDSCRSC